jgi:hypothetical protein
MIVAPLLLSEPRSLRRETVNRYGASSAQTIAVNTRRHCQRYDSFNSGG